MSDDTKEIHVVWTNTDLTEGRGRQHPIGWFDSRADAIEFGKKKYVMGSDCSVTRENAVRRDGLLTWWAPVAITPASQHGKKLDGAAEAAQAARVKALALGLSPDEIKALSGAGS